VQSRWSFKRRSTWVLIAAPALTMAGLTVAAAGPAAAGPAGPSGMGTAHSTAAAPVKEHFTVKPNKVNMLDCNGWSLHYTSANPGFRKLCTDPRGPERYTAGFNTRAGGTRSGGRFVDNGHYVGHDEPSVKFISNAAGSGNTMTYFMKVPRDPTRAPTNSGTVTKYAELSPAPWFGLPICDPQSYPINPCTPDSDSNTGGNSPTDAGSAFMELQMYAPGFRPFQDNVSCSGSQWCLAMTIDSLASHFNFVDINPNCPEPVNFAYLQTNGVPAGPPSPQLTNGHTFTPNAHTLKVNPGDVLKLAITDPSAGFTATVTDMTTHVTGFMTASAANGFMNTNAATCSGSPFTFHAEYNTARPQNQVPWAALEGGVLMQQEIGHGEVCASLTHHAATTSAGLVDNKTFDTCVGGPGEGRHHVGEGSCNIHTGVCQHPMTEGTTGPIACPSNNFASGQLCEFADGTCVPQGSRTITLNGVKTTVRAPVNFCEANKFQNGDLDFDGVSYQRNTWPNGTSSTPTSFRYVGPFTSGHTYPQVQFETDAAGSEFLCNIFDGNLCLAPPLAAKFYPFFTLTSKTGQNVGNGLFPAHSCVWNFGNVIRNVTTRNLGKDAQYGQPDVVRFGGTIITPAPITNPEISGGCPALTAP
jgi:hypothetical protein